MPLSEAFLREIEDNFFNKELLDLSYQSIEDDDMINIMHSIEKNTYIKRINLQGNFITDAGIKEFTLNEKITMLNISENRLTSGGTKVLANCHFSALNISANEIGDEGLTAFCTNKKLLELIAQSCNISGKGASALISSNDTLKVLNLSSNSLSSSVLTAIPSNNTLTCLLLDSTELTSENIACFLENNSIRTINLNSNEIDDDGAVALSQVNNLERVYLRNNRISDTGAKALLNSKIKVIELEGNFTNYESRFEKIEDDGQESALEFMFDMDRYSSKRQKVSAEFQSNEHEEDNDDRKSRNSNDSTSSAYSGLTLDFSASDSDDPAQVHKHHLSQLQMGLEKDSSNPGTANQLELVNLGLLLSTNRVFADMINNPLPDEGLEKIDVNLENTFLIFQAHCRCTSSMLMDFLKNEKYSGKIYKYFEHFDYTKFNTPANYSESSIRLVRPQ